MSKHGGNIRQLAEKVDVDGKKILDFSANINPLGAPSWLRATISRHIEDLGNYPDPDCLSLREALAKKWQCGIDSLWKW